MCGITLPSSDADKKQIASVIRDISNQLTQKEAFATSINEAKKALREDWDYDTKTVNRLVNMYHKQNKDEEQESFDDATTLYEALGL